MDQFVVQEDVYIAPTPAGAYYYSASAKADPARRLLRALFCQDETPRLSNSRLESWCESDTESARHLLYHMQSQSLLQAFEQAHRCPEAPLEELLPTLLPTLSGDGKALLADDQGFYVASSGFPHEAAEELAALSANLGILHRRHKRLLSNNLGYQTSAWTLGDAAGNSQIGFWPLFIGAHRFSLVIGGIPRLNRKAFTQLVWSLGIRYSE